MRLQLKEWELHSCEHLAGRTGRQGQEQSTALTGQDMVGRV